MVSFYGSSVAKMVQAAFPEYSWQPWRFRRKRGYFNDHNNALEFLRIFMKEKGIKKPEDWYNVKSSEFVRYGAKELLLNNHGSVFGVLQYVYPDYNWEASKFIKEHEYWKDSINQLTFLEVFIA